MADRVIILDIHRAGMEIRPRDIKQMCGRSGRMHGQEEADVHLIVPNSDVFKWKELIEDSGAYEVRSNFNSVPVLAFHVISQIVHGDIYNKESFNEWYDRTLDKFQRESRGESVPEYEKIAKELHDTGAAKFNEITGEIKAKPLGKICATFYFSPYDVRDWFRNINRLHKLDLLWNDACQAWAIANINSAIEWENDEIKKQTMKICENIESRGLFVKSGVLARLLAVDCALNGRRPRCDLPVFFSVKKDLPRILSAIEAICQVSRRLWGDLSSFVEALNLRQKYGISSKYVELVKLPGIGKTTAKNLYDIFDVHTEKDLIENIDLIRREANPGLKRSLTKYEKAQKKESKESKKPKVSYRATRRISYGKDEFEE